jgi:D-alanyl-D-alanine carboxypeptidase
VPLQPAPWGQSPALRPGASPPPRIGALSAVVLDEASAAVLYESDAHRRLPPASLTKIAASVVALRAGGLDEEAVSDVDGFMMRGSTIMGLYAGDRLSRRDLLYGLMLPSGNDAALALGRNVAGSDEAFVAKMNALVEELGLRDTRFDTPHGLGRTGYSSAYDLAILSRHAMQLPEFANIVQSTTWKVTGSRSYNVHNVNSFLFNFAGADGIKTGFTNAAGKTMVASATRDGHRLYAVILNDPATTSDASALLEWAFRSHIWSASVETPTTSTVSSARTTTSTDTR